LLGILFIATRLRVTPFSLRPCFAATATPTYARFDIAIACRYAIFASHSLIFDVVYADAFTPLRHDDAIRRHATRCRLRYADMCCRFFAMLFFSVRLLPDDADMMPLIRHADAAMFRFAHDAPPL